MPNLTPTPSDILDERLSDILLSQKKAQETNRKLAAMCDLAMFAATVVMRAAASGNAQCRDALPEIFDYLAKLK